MLFRSDFVLVSEKNYMKVHKNQWFWDRPYSPDHLPGAISRGHPRVPGGADAFAVPDRGRPYSDVDVQLLENKALSRDIIHKSACILAEITIRKSQEVSVCPVGQELHAHVRLFAKADTPTYLVVLGTLASSTGALGLMSS